jgi:hypothetical protein
LILNYEDLSIFGRGISDKEKDNKDFIEVSREDNLGKNSVDLKQFFKIDLKQK